MIKINSNTMDCCSVELHTKHRVSAHYSINKHEDVKIPTLNVVAGMRDGRTLSIFFNRESGLFVADIIAKHNKGGNEFVRVNLNTIKTPTETQCEEAE